MCVCVCVCVCERERKREREREREYLESRNSNDHISIFNHWIGLGFEYIMILTTL
jgi:hypothetical protein